MRLRIEGLNLVAVFIGGSVGACLRVGIDELTLQPAFKSLSNFSVGVLVVNLLGVMCLSYIKFYDLAKAQQNLPSNPKNKLLMLGITTGMLGAFTTYSSLALAATGAHWWRGVISVSLLLVLGLPAAAVSGKLGYWWGTQVGK